MKSIAELDLIREKIINETTENGGIRIVVGMATCGIAAGARLIIDTFKEEMEKRKVQNVFLNMTGCIGVCRFEPIAEVFESNGERTTYVNLSPEKVSRIVAEHIVNGKPVLEYTIGMAD